MVHWAFLILAFIAGLISCYGILHRLLKIASRVESAINDASKAF